VIMRPRRLRSSMNLVLIIAADGTQDPRWSGVDPTGTGIGVAVTTSGRPVIAIPPVGS
jgi:hypothetical protein